MHKFIVFTINKIFTMKNYYNFTVNDFIDDESFRNYVLRKSPSDIIFWTTWISENREKKEAIDEAEKLVHLLAAGVNLSLSDNAINEEWQKLYYRIGDDSLKNKFKKPTLIPFKGINYKWLLAAAASIAIFMATFFLLKKDILTKETNFSAQIFDKSNNKSENVLTIPIIAENEESIIKTPFGKTQKIILPDGSTVLLNANSALRFSKNWSKSADRIVWLDGEAEFSVKHYDLPQRAAQKFIVNTKGVNVEVIGTRFNLMSRAEKCKIALYEGTIQLYLTKHPEQERIAIEPNEIAQIDNGVVVRISQIKKIEVYQAWTKQHFEFDNTPLSEVALLVENTYGLKFVFKEESLKNKRLTASIPDDDVDVLVKVICQIFNIKTQQSNSEIIFENKN